MCPIYFCHSAGLTIIISPPDFTRFIFYLFFSLLNLNAVGVEKKRSHSFSECILLVDVIVWMNPFSVVWLEVLRFYIKLLKKKKAIFKQPPLLRLLICCRGCAPEPKSVTKSSFTISNRSSHILNKYKRPGLFIYSVNFMCKKLAYYFVVFKNWNLYRPFRNADKMLSWLAALATLVEEGIKYSFVFLDSWFDLRSSVVTNVVFFF